MSDYKRLTKKFENGYVMADCTNCPSYKKCDDRTHYCQTTIKDRLTDLEDKIENGTLVELPCKVGDMVYYTSPEYYNSLIVEYIVNEISITREGLRLAVYGTTNEKGKTAYLWSDFIGKTVFLTKVEAEAKLKERKEKQQ